MDEGTNLISYVQETENYVRLAVIMAVVMSKPKYTTLEEYVTYLKNKLESYVSTSVCEASDTQQDFEQTVLSIQQEDLISKIRNIVINPQSLTQSGESAAAARAAISNDTTRHKPTSAVVRATDSLDEAVSNVQFIQAIIDLKTAANEDSTVPVEDVHRILSLAPSETASDQNSGVISSATIQYLTRTRPVNDLLLRSVERVLSGLSRTILRAGLDRLDKCVRSYQGSSEQYIADTVSSLLDVLCGRTEQYYECVDTCLRFVKEMIETMLVRTGCQSGEHLVLEKQCTIILELSKNRYLCDKVISYTSDQILELATCVQKRSTKRSEAIKDSITQQESRLERSFYLFHLTENLLVEYKQIHGVIAEKKRRVKPTVANTRAAVTTGNYVSEWRNKWFNEIATESFEEKEYKESLRCLCGWEDSLRRSAVVFTETRAHLLSVYSWQCVELIKSFY
uniref:(California timema) hypothetical protein n=1 Tax=Timema californicum TaxID=61474 RepID=A0A7R9J425_TIMCA|nr:unnamed protein product [Timema californicum]